MKHIPLKELLTILLLCVGADAQRRVPSPKPNPAPPITVPPPTPAPTPFTNTAFNPTSDTLPPNFRGVDPLVLWLALGPRAAELQKDEFETTETHRLRVAALKDKPLVGNVTLSSLLATPTDLRDVKYDADAERMSAVVDFNDLRRVEPAEARLAARREIDSISLSCTTLSALGDPSDSIDPTIRKLERRRKSA